MIDRTRTIHLARVSAGIKAAIQRLGIGKYRPRPKSSVDAALCHYGWFLSPDEMALLDAERAKIKTASRAAKKLRDAEYRRTAKAKSDAARREAAQRDRHAQLVEEWREECAHPAPGRSEPEACWRYVLRAHGMPLDTPMPDEAPARRVVVRAEDYMTRGDGEAVLVRQGTARRPE